MQNVTSNRQFMVTPSRHQEVVKVTHHHLQGLQDPFRTYQKHLQKAQEKEQQHQKSKQVSIRKYRNQLSYRPRRLQWGEEAKQNAQPSNNMPTLLEEFDPTDGSYSQNECFQAHV